MAYELTNPGDIECCPHCDEPHSDEDGKCQCPCCDECDEQIPDTDCCEHCKCCEGCCECVYCECCGEKGDFELCPGCGKCCSARGRSGCCTCYVCNHCGERVEYVCGTCDCCEDCCDCTYCDRCGERFSRDDVCYSCGYCSECCSCSTRDGIFRTNGTHFFTAKRTERKRNKSKRYVGCEIEVDGYSGEGYNIADAVDSWSGSIVHDGSLGCGGIEIVTSPASGDKLCDMIDAIGLALKDDKAYVSTDCGLHIHIDARDYTHYDMRRLIALYAALEPAIMDTQPKSRRRNTYCSPCGKTLSNGLKDAKRPRDTKSKLLENIYRENPHADRGRGIRCRRQDKYDGARYMALNLHSWLYRGTVECRLHTGTVSARKIKAWAMLWADILDYALATAESKITAKAANLTKKGAKRWLRKIARSKETRRYLDDRWQKYGDKE